MLTPKKRRFTKSRSLLQIRDSTPPIETTNPDGTTTLTFPGPATITFPKTPTQSGDIGYFNFVAESPPSDPFSAITLIGYNALGQEIQRSGSLGNGQTTFRDSGTFGFIGAAKLRAVYQTLSGRILTYSFDVIEAP